MPVNSAVEGFSINNNELPWNLQLANRYNFLDEGFEPEVEYIGDGHFFDVRASAMLLEMLEHARAEGLSPVVRSSYRSVARQQVLFEAQVQRQLDSGLSQEAAFEAARRVVAYPGSSEHNLGLAVDIVSLSHGGLTAAFGQTAEGIWLAQNAHRFGFILRYPDHKQHITHIIYEPWHFRYVGAEHATVMFENDWVLEEYIYQLALD
jgi:D-alanyl-D-alanine carboxypeptidase